MLDSNLPESRDPQTDLPVRFTPLVRQHGVTDAERYLHGLCDKSFLRLWSYSGLYRDQDGGKEIADVIVVFGQHIIIFSDKSCAFPTTGKLDVDWGRWFRRAVIGAAKQAWGAERWLLDHPHRVFVDRECKIPFPLQLPRKGEAIVHRIVVAHNVTEPCRKVRRGSGSLMLVPSLGSTDSLPFAVGDLDPTRGYVHVLDDHALNIVLRTLDTVSDFVQYLEDKEALIRGGRLLSAAGEEDLLALYLKHGDSRRHAFPAPEKYTHIGIDEGFWEEFSSSPQRRGQIAANEVSYTWDDLIGEFEKHFLAGTSEFRSHTEIGEMEPVLRAMAAENRTIRRYLSERLRHVLGKVAPGDSNPGVGLVLDAQKTGTLYLFLAFPQTPDISRSEYRERRRVLLEAYTLVARYLHPTVTQVVGIATEPLYVEGTRSEDAMLLRSADWTAEAEQDAKRFHEELGLLKNVTPSMARVVEYPLPFGASDPETRTAKSAHVSMAGRDRNKPCPCGSGKKLKRCHGAP